MAIQDVLQSVTDRVSSVATVNTVFGEPRVMDGRAIIPVAMVAGGFGAGGGEGKAPAEGDGQQCQEGTGGGGGGGFAVRPLAVLEVSGQGTRLIPVLDFTKIILGTLGFIGGMFWAISKMKAKNNNRRLRYC